MEKKPDPLPSAMAVAAGAIFMWVRMKPRFGALTQRASSGQGCGQLDGGSRFVMAISRPAGPKYKAGMSLVFTGTIWHPNGQVHYVTMNQSCIDPDTTHSVVTGVDQDGKAIPKVIRTHKRKK